MSRGGARGGGRGGRGGGRGGRPQLSWDTGELEADVKPSELFPPRDIKPPRPLTISEASTVNHFLVLRRQHHASDLYTSRKTLALDPTRPRKMYGTAQTNALYGVRNRASQDPFTGVPTYGQRFVREERALPDWSRQPVCREIWPQELLDAVDPQTKGSAGGVGGAGGQQPRKRRRLELSRVSALPNAEEAFGMPSLEGDVEHGEGDDAVNGRNLLERLDAMADDEDGEEGEEEDELKDDGEDEDHAYDDEDAGDYDAENYFDNGDEMGEDYGDDGDGEGTF